MSDPDWFTQGLTRPSDTPSIPCALPQADDFEALRANFQWTVPERFNIAAACCDAWAATTPDRPCLLHFDPQGSSVEVLTYGELKRRSEALAADMRRRGIERGDRVALLLPQGFAVAIAHMAIYRIGAIAVPLALLFGPDALTHRIDVSGAKAVVATSDRVSDVRNAAEGLEIVYSADGAVGDAIDLPSVLSETTHVPVAQTWADDPALMVFTSGTTGPPKGALHAHRVVLGHVPGVQTHHMPLPLDGDVLWTPADWAWTGGLLNVLLPGLLMGVPVVSIPPSKFDAEQAFTVMERMRVTRTFMPPTALRLMRGVERPRDRFDLSIRTIGSGGEQLGRPTHEWAKDALVTTVNEFYGQTECNLVLSGCAALGIEDDHAIGRAVPGHEVAIVGGEGQPLPAGQTGQIAVRRPDPVMFLRYWDRPEATEAKFVGDWMLTGDQGTMDERGYVHFEGRDDDIITSSGYRIGPGEIEDCLTAHPDVSLAAAVGKPDPLRTEIVKAYVVPRNGANTQDLATRLRDHVKTRLSAHEYPREIEFVTELPMTTTGKVIRRELRERARGEIKH